MRHFHKLPPRCIHANFRLSKLWVSDTRIMAYLDLEMPWQCFEAHARDCPNISRFEFQTVAVRCCLASSHCAHLGTPNTPNSQRTNLEIRGINSSRIILLRGGSPLDKRAAPEFLDLGIGDSYYRSSRCASRTSGLRGRRLRGGEGRSEGSKGPVLLSSPWRSRSWQQHATTQV